MLYYFLEKPFGKVPLAVAIVLCQFGFNDVDDDDDDEKEHLFSVTV